MLSELFLAPDRYPDLSAVVLAIDFKSSAYEPSLESDTPKIKNQLTLYQLASKSIIFRRQHSENLSRSLFVDLFCEFLYQKECGMAKMTILKYYRL